VYWTNLRILLKKNHAQFFQLPFNFRINKHLKSSPPTTTPGLNKCETHSSNNWQHKGKIYVSFSAVLVFLRSMYLHVYSQKDSWFTILTNGTE